MESLNNSSHQTLMENYGDKDKFLSILTILFSLTFVVHLYSRIFKNPNHSPTYYSKIPTIRSLPIVGCLSNMIWHARDLPNLTQKLSKKYGMTFRSRMFGKEFVFLNDPKYLQKLFWSTKPGHLEKPSIIYRFLTVLEGSLASLPVKEWKAHRNIIEQAFTYSSLLNYIEVLNGHSKKMVADMHDQVNGVQQTFKNDGIANIGQKNHCLYDFINLATFKIVSEIIVGSDFLSPEETLQVHEHAEHCKEIMSYRLFHPWFLPNFVWKLHSKSRKLNYHFNKILETLRKAIKRSKEEVTSRNLKTGILDYLSDSDLTNEQILPEVILQYSGTDTLNGTMNFVLFNLALHQEHQEKCRKEIDVLFEKLEKNGSGTDLTMNDMAEMKYVEQCIKESQRIFPAIPFYARELYSPLQLEPDLELKSGTIVVISPLIVQRDPRIYPDPEKFDPDRFLPENCAKRSPCAFLPFSHGSRNCIAWKVAQLEMKILTAYILRNFELTTENTMETIMEKLRKRMWPYDDFGVNWIKRK